MLWRFLINLTGCVGITIYLFEIIFTLSIKENNVLVKLLEASFGSNILASFNKFHCQGTETFCLVECKFLKFTYRITFLHK